MKAKLGHAAKATPYQAEAILSEGRPSMTRSDIDHYSGLTWWGPYEQNSIEACVALVPPFEEPRAIDIGCGNGALLRLLATSRGARCTGVDRSAAALATARRSFEEAHLPEPTLLEASAATLDFAPASFEIVAWHGGPYVGDSHASTMQAFARWLTPGGSLLLGLGYWRVPPPPAYLEATGLEEAALTDERTLLTEVEAAGLVLQWRMESTRELWDHFEGTLHANHEAHAAAHPDDAEIQEVLAGKRAWQDAQRRWGRDVMGFSVYTVHKPH